MGIIRDRYISDVVKNFNEIHIIGTDMSYDFGEGKYFSPPFNEELGILQT